MMRRQGSTIGGLRRGLYRSARLLGDLHAVTTGRIGRRLFNKGLGRILGRFFLR